MQIHQHRHFAQVPLLSPDSDEEESLSTTPQETHIEVLTPDATEPKYGNHPQISWFYVVLITVTLAWLCWKGTEVIANRTTHPDLYWVSSHKPDTIHQDARSSVQDDYCTVFMNAYQAASKNPGKPLLNSSLLQNVNQVLRSFNKNCERNFSIVLEHQGCLQTLFPFFTTQRLRLRLDERYSKAKNFSVQVKNLLHAKDGKPLLLTHAMYDLRNQQLGNWMFMVASLYGAARLTHRLPVITRSFSNEIFFRNLPLPHTDVKDFFGTNDSAVMNSRTRFNPNWGKYDPNLLSFEDKTNMQIDGYTQSFLHFAMYRKEVKDMFYNVLNNRIGRVALYQLSAALANFTFQPYLSTLTRLPRLVGVHVRRGDILHEPHASFGFKASSEEYLLRSVYHVQLRYAPVVFVVISNDMDYCRQLFKEPNFIFLEKNIKEVDMLLLSLMDYVILTAGSFGWWGAYLSDAHQVYYDPDWPRNGSQMQALFSHDQYFPAEWIPL